MGSVFRFKEFEVNQQGCAMKINTDGVLLGAMVKKRSIGRVLDIGTGTGVIALMIAQRFDQALIDAVEIDQDAYKASQLNFQNSKFKNRITGFFCSFEELKPMYKYELIVSNPPFYTNSLHNPDLRKKIARHTDLFFFDKLINYANEYLSAEGQLEIILPVEVALYVRKKAESLRLYVTGCINIRSFEHTEVIRQIIKLGRIKKEECTENFFIYESQGIYSSSYKAVLQPFFLAF